MHFQETPHLGPRHPHVVAVLRCAEVLLDPAVIEVERRLLFQRVSSVPLVCVGEDLVSVEEVVQDVWSEKVSACVALPYYVDCCELRPVRSVLPELVRGLELVRDDAVLRDLLRRHAVTWRRNDVHVDARIVVQKREQCGAQNVHWQNVEVRGRPHGRVVDEVVERHGC